MAKQELRSKYLNNRRALDPHYRYNATAIINQLLFTFVKEGNFRVIASYLPIGSELDLSLFNHKIGQKRYTLLFPQIVGEGIIFTKMNSKQSVIPELIIIPSICFDMNRYRLGYGKAYYDRVLNDLKHRQHEPYKIIPNFSKLMVDSIPVESWDVSADLVIHEEGSF